MRRERKKRYQDIGFNANLFGFCFNANLLVFVLTTIETIGTML